MVKYSDLAPWIMGAMVTAAIAVAITAGSINRTAPKALPAPSPAIGKILPAAAALPGPAKRLAAEPSAAAAPPATPDAQTPQSLTQPMAAGQIWECMTNGQKTFSNNPCGEKSSLRELGPINTMDPTPPFRRPREFLPESNYAQDDSYPGAPDDADDYQSQAAIPYLVHTGAERTHRPFARRPIREPVMSSRVKPHFSQR